jgi:flavin-binding protein dodecin
VSSVAKVIEIIASSDISFEDAVSNGIEKASESIKNITSA